MSLESRLMHRVDALRTQARHDATSVQGALFLARRALQRVQTGRALDGLLDEVLPALEPEHHASAQREWQRLAP